MMCRNARELKHHYCRNHRWYFVKTINCNTRLNSAKPLHDMLLIITQITEMTILRNSVETNEVQHALDGSSTVTTKQITMYVEWQQETRHRK
jgi:hypothetical protein